MFRIGSFVIALLLSAGPAYSIQNTLVDMQSVDSQSVDNDEASGLNEQVGDGGKKSQSIDDVYGFVALTFILLMFTNAIICGQWAINTNRNFWGWYLFGLFTGPLAGGCMLHRTARDKTGEDNPGGAWGAIAGISIPFAGWIVWVMILK